LCTHVASTAVGQTWIPSTSRVSPVLDHSRARPAQWPATKITKPTWMSDDPCTVPSSNLSATRDSDVNRSCATAVKHGRTRECTRSPPFLQAERGLRPRGERTRTLELDRPPAACREFPGDHTSSPRGRDIRRSEGCLTPRGDRAVQCRTRNQLS
jgi:hypothetical protein